MSAEAIPPAIAPAMYGWATRWAARKAAAEPLRRQRADGGEQGSRPSRRR